MPAPAEAPRQGTGKFSRRTPGDMRTIVTAERLLEEAPIVIAVIELLAGIDDGPKESADEMVTRMRAEAIQELFGS